MADSDIRNKAHWAMPSYRQRITSKELKSILLNHQDTIIRFGSCCSMRKKSLGVGIYEIWFEPDRG